MDQKTWLWNKINQDSWNAWKKENEQKTKNRETIIPPKLYNCKRYDDCRKKKNRRFVFQMLDKTVFYRKSVNLFVLRGYKRNSWADWDFNLGQAASIEEKLRIYLPLQINFVSHLSTTEGLYRYIQLYDMWNKAKFDID